MAENDYICVYRQFFEEFAKSSDTEDNRPMRVNLYSLTIDELVGEVMQFCVNFFIERCCPKGLIVPLTKIVVDELLNEAKKQPEDVNTPLKLNRKTLDKISEVCLRYIDNEKLSSLPGPVQETVYSTHATKHTKRRMEDRLVCLPRFNSIYGVQTNSEAGYYGIFDGHAGVNAACFAVSHLHQFLAESEHYPDDPVLAFRQAYDKTEFRYNSKGENSGTTALAILHQPIEKKLIVSWIGDSQAMLVSQDSYVMLVDPHKPDRKDESKRIKDLGGFIIKIQSVCRVNGGLAISRAIGDQKFKPFVSAEPEFRVINLTGSEHFVVMGCDGLWDVVKPHEAIETVYFEVTKNGGNIDTVARRLVDLAKENNSTDNISVIVIFLTDPSELSNRPIDVTGHRPKVVLQNGVIMEANFQTSETLSMNDSGMNEIYEANGNHFEDHKKNEFDEDFGPETDVDAIDDVLSSPKNMNPFSNDCRQKTQITVGEIVEDGIRKFLDDFSVSVKQETIEEVNDVLNMKYISGSKLTSNEKICVNEINTNNTNDGPLSPDMNVSDLKDDLKLSNFSADHANPFDTPIINDCSDVLDFRANGTEDNRFMEEVNMEGEKLDNFMKSDFDSSERKIEEFSVEKSEVCNSLKDPKSVEMNLNEPETNDTVVSNEDSFNITSDSGMENTAVVEPEIKSDTAPMLDAEPGAALQQETEVMVPEEKTNLKNDMENEIKEVAETISTNEPAQFFPSENVPTEGEECPPEELCSVVDVLELQRISKLSPTEEDSSRKDDDSFEAPPELLSPSAPILEGEVKDDVAESGGEVDSEDEEWNYYKGESEVPVPVDCKPNDLVPPVEESSETDKNTMASPLNPDAAEFVPVSPVLKDEAPETETPTKKNPLELSDIIASSPNWSNMDAVAVPEESEFLNDIKSKPTNIFEELESPQKQDFNYLNSEPLTFSSSQLGFSSPVNSEKKLDNNGSPEVHGIALASDMTSSFIDPSTMSSPNEERQDQFGSGFGSSEVVEPVIEKKTVSLSNEAHPVEDFLKAESDMSSKVPDLWSPISNEETASLVSPTPETPKSPTVDTTTFSAADSQPLVSETVQPEPTAPQVSDPIPEIKTPPSSPVIEPVQSESKDSKEKVSGEESNQIASAAKVAIAAGAVAATAGAAAAKKDAKKAPAKTSPSKVAPKTTMARSSLTETKTSTTTKKPLSALTTKSPVSGKVTTTFTTKTATSSTTKTTPLASTKAPTSRPLTTTKTTPKTSTSVTSTVTKTQVRPKTTATNTITRTSPVKSSLTSTTGKSTTAPKPSPRPLGTTAPAAAPRPKPRVPSAPLEKKTTTTTTTMNGDAKTGMKRTETTTTTITRKPGSTMTTTTRVSLSARPATAPAKPTTLKTASTTPRTTTAKPKTSVLNSTTGTVTSKALPATRKTTVGTDKLAKEMANRLTSKTTTTTTVTKTNGVGPGKTTTLTKTKKTITTTTPSKTDNETEITVIKAEKIVDGVVDIIESKSENPLINTDKDINIINSIASD